MTKPKNWKKWFFTHKAGREECKLKREVWRGLIWYRKKTKENVFWELLRFWEEEEK